MSNINKRINKRWTDIELKQLDNHINEYGFKDFKQIKQLSKTIIRTRTAEHIRKKLHRMYILNNNKTGLNNNGYKDYNDNNNSNDNKDNNDNHDNNDDDDDDNKKNDLHSSTDDNNCINNNELRSGKWTNDEMKCLHDGMKRCGSNIYPIHLAKEIATIIPSRTLKQITRKVYVVLKENDNNNNNDDDDKAQYHKGLWKDDEIQRLNDAIQKYGRNDTHQLSLAAQTRSMNQIRSLFYHSADSLRSRLIYQDNYDNQNHASTMKATTQIGEAKVLDIKEHTNTDIDKDDGDCHLDDDNDDDVRNNSVKSSMPTDRP